MKRRSRAVTIAPILMVCYWCRARPNVMCRYKGVECSDFHDVRRDDAATATWILRGRPLPMPRALKRRSGCAWRV